MKKKEPITWIPKRVSKKNIVPTPNNYKIKTDVGMERFRKSKELFGLAGTVVANPVGGGKVMLIDGNTRMEESTESFLWVSLPNRKLTPKEFEEMSAMYDFAKAGEVDTERIMGELGKTKDFFDKWNIDIPMEVLARIGGANGVEDVKYPGKKSKKVERAAGAAEQMDNVRMVNLFFTKAQHDTFIKMEEKLAKRFSTESITDTIFEGMKVLTKGK